MVADDAVPMSILAVLFVAGFIAFMWAVCVAAGLLMEDRDKE